MSYQPQTISRRQVLSGAVAWSAAWSGVRRVSAHPVSANPQPAAGVAPAPIYDLLITGGHVIDPAARLSEVRDVAIAGGRIAAIDRTIASSQARELLDARGKLVTPGWIDMHVHVYDGVTVSSIEPDAAGVQRGATTIVDAGSAGATTFAGFRKHVIERARTSVYACLNVSRIGWVVSNESYLDPALIDVEAATRVVREHRDRIVGIKVRVDGRSETADRDLEILTQGRRVADATGVPVLLHWTRDARMIAMLKAGDIVTHPFNPPRAGPDLMGSDGAIMRQYLDLPSRGIVTDFAHGSHLRWATAETAARAGWFPDIISTDLHRAHIAPNGIVVDLARTMTKFLWLGLSLEQVIERVTTAPAKAFSFGGDPPGTLRVGAAADVTIAQLVEQPIELFDSLREKRVAPRELRHVATIKSGAVVRTPA